MAAPLRAAIKTFNAGPVGQVVHGLRRVALVATLLAFAVYAPALAQSPPLPGAPGPDHVILHAERTELSVSLSQPDSVDVTVTNGDTPTGTPLDVPRHISISVAGSQPGWTLGLSPSPASFELAPGASGTAKLSVAVAAGAQASSIDITFKARMDPLSPSIPAGSPFGAGAEATTAFTARHEESLPNQFAQGLGPYLWVLILGLVAAAVVIATLLAANRRIAVRLSCAETDVDVVGGTRRTVAVRVHNLTRHSDTVLLRAGPMPDGWSVYLPNAQLDLEGGQQEEVSAVVMAPRGAEEGLRQAVELVATSAQSPRRPAALHIMATVSRRKKSD